MALTAKQEAFSQAIADGMTRSDAYRSAYNAAKMKPDSVNVNASKLASDAKVALRIAELKSAIASKGLWTREKSVLALSSIADSSEAKANEIVAAVKELNLMHGFNAPLKINVDGELIHKIERILVRPADSNS